MRSLARLFLSTILILTLASLLIAAAPGPQGAEPPVWTSLVSVLTWVAAGGAFLYVGKALTYLLEKVPGWGTKFPAALRAPTVLILGIGIALGADYLLTQSAVLAVISPWFQRIMLLAFVWYGSQDQFEKLKAAGRITRPLVAKALPPTTPYPVATHRG